MTKRSPSAPALAHTFDRGGALKSLGLSLTINALCPFLLYGILQPHFPPNSVLPLLYATIFPVIGLMLSLLRKRAVDGVAIITMVGLAFHDAQVERGNPAGPKCRSRERALTVREASSPTMILKRPMAKFLIKLLLVARSRLKSRTRLDAEDIVLRQRVIILSRRARPRVRLRNIG